MLSIDLFATQFERELREGAVDDLEYRRMNDLREKMEMLMQAYKKADTEEVKNAIMKRYNEYKSERESYTKVREQQVPSKQDPFAYVKPEPKGIGDIQDPRQKMAQLAQRSKKGPLANVGAGLKGFLTGKEEPLDEQELGRRGIGVRNMKALEATIRQGLAKTVFQFPKVRPVAADEEDSDILADYYNGLDSAGRSNFVYNVLGDPMKFSQLCKSLNIQLIPMGAIQPDLPGIPSQGELPLEEKKSQKKKFKSTVAQREIEKAMAAEPAAGDPIEAFVLKTLKTDSDQDQQIQDLENQLKNMVTKTVAPKPTVMPKVQPSSTVAPAPTPVKSTPTPISTATQAPVELPVPTPTAEPAPTTTELPKKDRKILSQVKSIEKRLKDRVDAYQDARAQQDKAALQQQIDALQAQAKQQASKLSPSGRLVLDQYDVYDIEANLVREPELEPIQLKKAAESKMQEHGGGIGPRQHWQDLMQEGQPQELINRYLAIDAENDVDAVRAAIQAISRDPALSVTSKSRLLGQIGMIIKRHRLPIGRSYYQFMQQYMEAVELDRGKVAGYPQDPATVKHRLDTAKAILGDPRSDADSRREAAAIVAKSEKKVVAETVANVKAGMAEIYRRLAPKIERHRDSFLAGQLYDELENYAELHGAEGEFKRMMSTARNRAHMEYDTNPGGFQNWFWFLPFEDNDVTESTDDLKKKMSKLEALALAANRAGDDAKCKMYQQKIQSLKQKLSQSMTEELGNSPVATAIARRILSQRTDLVTKYGDKLVDLAIDEVADYVGDVDEIGSSDVSGWVAQVERMLRENPPEAFAEGWSDQGNPTAYSVYIDGREWRAYKSDEHARAVADKVQANLRRQGRDQTVTIAPSKTKKVQESDEQLLEGIKDTASATAVIACLLTGGSLTGCATAPQQTSAQQVLKTGQDMGRIAMNAKKITRAGTEEEARQELRNILRGVSGRPEELNHSNILRIWRRVNKPEPQNEAKEPTNRQEYFAIIDRLDKEIAMEQNRAVKQMLMSRRMVLQQHAQDAGWIPKKELREDTAALAAEDAILKRIFVKHRDLMMEYGPEKVMQAAESVAYNVGDIAHITDDQIQEWVGQVEYILGARP